jgi:glycosyltransferase involved in cell wall biosynthesis
MTEWPLVGIVSPVLNGAEFIQRMIDSVRRQDYPHIEHIVMDGGSTDGTIDILRANEDCLKWHSEPDRGQSDAINKGFAQSTGQYLTWLNADDFLYPGAVRQSMEVFKLNPGVALVYGRLNLIRRDGSFWRDDRNIRNCTYEELLHWDNFMVQPGLIFTRQAWEACGPLNLNDHYAMDWDLWIKIGVKFPFKYTPQTFAAMAVFEGTKTVSGGLKRYEEILRMLERNGSRAPHAYYKVGLWHYQHSDMNKARYYFRIALSRGPHPVIRRRLISLILKTYLGARTVQLGRSLRSRIGV